MDNLYRLAAFPKKINGGNKAGVYLEADQLKVEDMQRIAKEVNYSETAFVSKSEIADFKVRFFTPTNEVDLCGHATIATFNLLKNLKLINEGIYTQETKAGILKLDVQDDFVFMEQPKPVFSEFVDLNELVECFTNLKISKNFKPQVISTGIKEIFLPVEDISTLNNLNPYFDKMISLAKKHNTIGIHAFCIDNDCDAYGRNFAPVVGIEEESATGTSNGALACYLFKYYKNKHNFILRQGYSMNQPSEIVVNLETDSLDNISKVWVGGKANIIE
ncbi:MAG: PhzF family phenazine biosynthesis protein [Candidatus Izemoplasmatales bacterium]|nr:PhzF family phenazine biosynthesis protein [Candidatus Izemoplasmatales bacterium]MDD4069221.1 PhzF family phenazine biosynthesis protein [Candidatus Izemoplasmatales bacterium]